jgi:cell division protein ZapE
MQPRDPRGAYAALIAEGRISADAAQAQVVGALQALHESLGQKRGFLKRKSGPRGLYIWGNVGRGKSMLMDLFFANAPVLARKRIHFHRFMQDVHASIHQLRQQRGNDPVVTMAQQLAQEVRLLCFDELQATDVADASLLFRLFEQLFAEGVIVVATSNHPPETLYTGGVQRERFQRFTELLCANMDVLTLSSPHDYRLQQIKSLHKVYHVPLNADAPRFIRQVLDTLAPSEHAVPKTLSVQGRDLTLQTYGDAIAQASFAQLCEAALGPADYLALAAAFETLILTDIPLLSPEKRNEAKRFVTLIDALYEQKTRLICTAAALPPALYPAGDGSFEFQRTASRLHEMQSRAWLER